MMIGISLNKTHYEKGQVFPFLIAIIVVIVIVTMITVNLGQVGIFKTDVSNAADAGALSAASTLSGYLLGFGLKSDYMHGFMIGALIMSVIEFVAYGWPVGLIMAIINNLVAQIKNYIEYYTALSDGKMAWSQAKKTALQYAFQNAGVDEPRPTFKQFLSGVYGISDPDSIDASTLATYYHYYTLGDGPSNRDRIRQYSQSGFSRFMEESRYWKWGKIEPGTMHAARLVSGYGWNDDGANSYGTTGDEYEDYENYVEVTVMGNVFYPLDIYNPIADFIEAIRDRLVDAIDLPWWLDGLEGVIDFLINLIFGIIAGSQKFCFPMGLEMDPIEDNTTNNPIHVWVKRYKRSKNVGLWNFRYGTAQGYAVAHAYGETGWEDIKPSVTSQIGDFINDWIGGTESPDWDDMYGLFDASQHLFESEITYAR